MSLEGVYKREKGVAEEAGLGGDFPVAGGGRLSGAAMTLGGIARRLGKASMLVVKGGALNFIGGRLLGDSQPQNLYAHLKDGTLHITHDAGFFSICTTALFEIAQNSREVEKVDASSSFEFFKSPGTLQNPWPLYFENPEPLSEQQSSRLSRSRLATRLPHHAEYWLVDFRSARPLVTKFFQPSRRVDQRIIDFKMRYALDMSKIIAVCFRGTDKGTELRQDSVGRYLAVVKRLARRYPEHRVLLQTDDSNAKNLFLGAFGQRVITIDEMPVTLGKVVMHKTLEASEREDFGLNLLAIVQILAEAHSVVTYTGNIGYWIALFRGGTRRLVQLR